VLRRDHKPSGAENPVTHAASCSREFSGEKSEFSHGKGLAGSG